MVGRLERAKVGVWAALVDAGMECGGNARLDGAVLEAWTVAGFGLEVWGSGWVVFPVVLRWGLTLLPC